jgi:hypothetical protein
MVLLPDLPAGLPPRPFGELRDSGLLWLINRAVLHPRGYALGLVYNDAGNPVGWQLDGDGTEPWRYGTDVDEDALFDAAEATLADLRS